MAAVNLVDSVQTADPRQVVIIPEVIEDFKRADQWLQPMRP